MQATEPYNNEESASRDEGGTEADSQISADNNMDNIEIDNMDNIRDIDNMDNIRDIDIENIDKISDIDNISNIDSTRNIDNNEEVWRGGIGADENTDTSEKMKNASGESMAAMINTNKTTVEAVRKNRLVNSEMEEGGVNMNKEVNNIKEVQTSSSVSRMRTTTVSTEGIVEMERLRTQVCARLVVL